MHINSIVFLNILHQHFMFATVSIIKNRKIKNTEDGMKQVHKLYIQRGLKITQIHADIEFESVCAEITDFRIFLNCASKKEHVRDIEWFKQAVKARVWSSRADMPFKQISKFVIFHLVASDILDKWFSSVKT